MSLDRFTVPALTESEQDTLNTLVEQLKTKMPRNRLRSAYYDGKNAVRSLGISTPPNFRRIYTVLGWSAKGVDILNRRCNLDGFYAPGSEDIASDIEGLWHENYLDLEGSQAGVSSLIHATAFLIATQGDTESGEPSELITAKDALSGTGEWDRRRRSLTSFLSVIDTDKEGGITEFVMYLPNLNITGIKEAGFWSVDRRSHNFGVPVEPLVYQPRLGRPFGSSRISRAVMSLHDSALRTVIRSEVTAELYSVPQRVLLGADESAFKNADGTVKTAWQAVLGRVWAIPDDEDASNPRADIKEFTTASQQPHVDQLRAWAQLFAGETSIPIASLGISGEANPTSEGAYDAGRDDLIREAEGTTDGWTPAWTKTIQRALAMRNGWDIDNLPDEAKTIQPNWRSPLSQSRAAAADAAGKTIDKFPWMAESELGLELYGFDEVFLERAKVELRRNRGRNVLETLRAAATNQPTVTDAGTDEATQ